MPFAKRGDCFGSDRLSLTGWTYDGDYPSDENPSDDSAVWLFAKQGRGDYLPAWTTDDVEPFKPGRWYSVEGHFEGDRFVITFAQLTTPP